MNKTLDKLPVVKVKKKKLTTKEIIALAKNVRDSFKEEKEYLIKNGLTNTERFRLLSEF